MLDVSLITGVSLMVIVVVGLHVRLSSKVTVYVPGVDLARFIVPEVGSIDNPVVLVNIPEAFIGLFVAIGSVVPLQTKEDGYETNVLQVGKTPAQASETI